MLLLPTLPPWGFSAYRVLELLVLAYGLERGSNSTLALCLGLKLGSDLEPVLGLWRALYPYLTSSTSPGSGLELEQESAHESLLCLEQGLRPGPREFALPLQLPLQKLLS